MEEIGSLVRRVKEAKRRERLHRQIGALDSKLDKIGNPVGQLARNRVYRLTSKLKRLKGELAQPELFL
jgi:hypothetical protein